MERERSVESHSLSSSPPTPNSEKNFKKNVCFRVTSNTDERNTMEWYVFNPNKSPSSEKTETHRRCSGCPRSHRFEKSDLASFARLGKHWESTSFVTLGSCIYCIGGHRKEAYEYFFLSRVLRFDTNRPQEGWKKVASMIKRRGCPRTEVIRGKIYVFGGYCYPDDDVGPWAEVFDPVEQVWRGLPQPPVSMESFDYISSVALEEDAKILVGFYSKRFQGCYAYHVFNRHWKFHAGEDLCMPPVIRNCRAQVVDQTVYWCNRENIFAYDLDKNIMFSGTVNGLKIVDDLVSRMDPPCLLHLGRENFGLICLGGAHEVSKSLFTCIDCAILEVSKCTMPNGRGILKITTQYVKSYFVEGTVRLLESCLIEGMLESDDGNVNDGSASRTTV